MVAKVDKKAAKAAYREAVAREQAERDEDALNPQNIAVDDLLGARDWKRSKFGFITGAGAIKDGAGSIITGGKAGIGRTKALFGAAFAKDSQGRAISDDISGARERFEAAMFANGRSESDVNKSVDNTYVQFYVFLAVLVGLLALGFGTIALYGFTIPQFPLFDILFRLMPLPIAGALLLRAGFTNWMFRNRRLDTVSAYLKSGELLPRKHISQKPRSGGGKQVSTVAKKTTGDVARAIFMIIALSFISSMFVPTDAFAQTTMPSQTDIAQDVFNNGEQTDLFIKLLQYLIPNVGPLQMGALGETPQHQGTKIAFMFFSGTLMFIAAAVSGWQILSGMVASAKEGTVLGKLYHEVWAPLRVVFGFGMLAPIAGGLCAAQIICLYLVVWGGNLANLVWTPYINVVTVVDAEKSAEDGKETIQFVNMSISNDAVKNVFQRELCWTSIDTYVKRLNGDGASLIKPAPFWEEITPSPVSQFFGDKNKYHEIDYGPACGKVQIRIPDTVTEGSAFDTAQNNGNRMALAQSNALQAMQKAMRSMASQISQTYQNTSGDSPRYFDPTNDTTPLTALLNDQRKNYSTAVMNAAAEGLNESTNGSLSKFREDSIREGWAAAGVFYLSIGRIQNAVYSAAANSARFDNYDAINAGNMPQYLNEAMYGTDEEPGVIYHFQSWWDKNIEAIAPDISAKAVEVANQSGLWESLMQTVFSGIMFIWEVGTPGFNDPEEVLNPMRQMIELGNRMMFVGISTYVGQASISGAAEGAAQPGVEGQVPVLGRILNAGAFAVKAMTQAVMSIAGLASLAIIAAGAIHAFVLPMLPYVMTVFFIGGLLLLTAEALIAAPIWAFFHIRMDGQDFVSDVQKPGYMIAFNLVLRPALMVFGLILSYLVFGAMAWFVDATFYPAAKSMAASSGAGIIGAIVMIIMLTYVHYQLAVRSFSMILQVPDRVTRWFGQGGERLGEEDDTNRSTGFIVGQVSNRMEGAAKVAGMRGVGSSPKGRVTAPETGGGALPPGSGGTKTTSG